MNKEAVKNCSKRTKQPTLVEVLECIEYFSHVAMNETHSGAYLREERVCHLRNAVIQLMDAAVELRMFLDELE